jgi:hypothetical protein
VVAVLLRLVAPAATRRATPRATPSRSCRAARPRPPLERAKDAIAKRSLKDDAAERVRIKERLAGLEASAKSWPRPSIGCRPTSRGRANPHLRLSPPGLGTRHLICRSARRREVVAQAGERPPRRVLPRRAPAHGAGLGHCGDDDPVAAGTAPELPPRPLRHAPRRRVARIVLQRAHRPHLTAASRPRTTARNLRRQPRRSTSSLPR